MLDFANRDVDAKSSSLIFVAAFQIELASAACESFRQPRDASLPDEATNPLSAIQHIARVVKVGVYQRFMFARAFVCELAVFRKTLDQLRSARPDLDASIREATASFDRQLPFLISMRDTLAHFDERAIQQQRGKPIAFKTPLDPEVVNRGLSLKGELFSGITADGHGGKVVIAPDTIKVSRATLAKILELFPKKPGHALAMQNFEQTFPDSTTV